MLRSNEQPKDITTLTKTRDDNYLKYNKKYSDKLISAEEWARLYRSQYKNIKANYNENERELGKLEYDSYIDYNKPHEKPSTEPYRSYLYQNLITHNNQLLRNRDSMHMNDQKYVAKLKNSEEEYRKRPIESLVDSYRGPVYYDEELSLSGGNADQIKECAGIRDGWYTRREPLDSARYEERRYLSAAPFRDRSSTYDFDRRIIADRGAQEPIRSPLNNGHGRIHNPEQFKFSIHRKDEVQSPLEHKRPPHKEHDALPRDIGGSIHNFAGRHHHCH
jgi:hypothetical protein